MNFSKLQYSKLLLSIFSILALATVIYLSTTYLRFSTDSAYYIMGADQISEGKGFYMYNIGFLADVDKDYQQLRPNIYYQPLYSMMLAKAINLFNCTPMEAVRLINTVFMFLFFLGWFCLFYRLLAGRPLILGIMLTALLVSAGLLSYQTVVLSEVVFIACLAGLANAIHYATTTYNQKRKYIAFVVAGLFSALLMLTRNAGLGIIIATTLFILLSIRHKKWKQGLLNFFLYLSVTITPYLLWLQRNLSLTGQALKTYPNNYDGTFFDIPRIIEILNYYASDTLNTPNRIESFAFLALLFIAAVFIFIIIRRKALHSSLFLEASTWWAVLVLIIYIGMIVYMAVYNRAVNRHIGFSRFFYLTQPLLFMVLLAIWDGLKQLAAKDKLIRLGHYIYIAFLAFLFLAALNRGRIFWQTLSPDNAYTKRFAEIEKKLPENHVLISHHWQTVTCYTTRPCLTMAGHQQVQAVRDSLPENKPLSMILIKGIGETWHPELPSWKVISKHLDYDLIYEDDMLFVATINKHE